MKSIGQKGKVVMTRQEKVKDNTVLAYSYNYEVISTRTVILQDGTSENDISANKQSKLLKNAFLPFKAKITYL